MNFESKFSKAVSMSWGFLKALHPEDRDRYLAQQQQAVMQGKSYEISYRVLARDGNYHWWVEQATRVRGEDGIQDWVVTCTPQVQSQEEELKARTEELTYLTAVLTQTNITLEKRNQELDQFAYVASHDLKAPLRAIANLSEWIEEDLAEQLTEETRHQMNLLRGRVHRMEALINGLLQYSRVGRLDGKKSIVSVADLLVEVIDSLSPPETFTIEVVPNMPILMTERLPLEQVFINLIGNAIKHHPRQNGKVTISVQEQKLFYEFAVADDGAGIAPQYHEKVFGIFQTLVARDKSENTGIGLAIVKKIVERQGGTIHLESQEGQGAIFRFTWPK